MAISIQKKQAKKQRNPHKTDKKTCDSRQNNDNCATLKKSVSSRTLFRLDLAYAGTAINSGLSRLRYRIFNSKALSAGNSQFFNKLSYYNR
jgi:hypothetical protein